MANTRNLCLENQHNLYSTDLRWGFALRVTQILEFALGVMQILAFRYQHVGIANAKIGVGVGVLSQCKDPTQMVLHRSGI